MQKDFTFSKRPVDFHVYQKALDEVLEQIRSGNTYLLNLTFKTPIETNFSLKEIFTYAKAKFKLYYKDEFICFSPERFVEIDRRHHFHLPDERDDRRKLTRCKRVYIGR